MSKWQKPHIFVPCGEHADDRLIVFCHGYGGAGISFDPLRSRWWQLLPDSYFAAPNGPFRDAGGQGWAWMPASMPFEQSIVAARRRFDAILSQLLVEHNVLGRLDRVALVGFSQGANIILDAVITGRWQVGAVMAYAGRVLEPPKRLPLLQNRIFLVHGLLDRVVSYEESEVTSHILKRAGANVRVEIMKNLGHGINEEAAEAGGRFLSSISADRPQSPSR